ncbi:MAG: thiamine-phosphate kinase [Hyphomicrobium sp.]
MTDRIANETELIQTFLAPLAAGAPGAFGLGDDAAVLSVAPDQDLVVTTDPVIAGVHFFADDRAEDIAWKALAVNVSDLAAKGADPVAYTLALAFPEAPERAWMSRFAQGLHEAQTVFGCHLVGGDTDRTPGPLSVGVTAFGAAPKGRVIRRSGARDGDRVFVTGTLGDAALGLRVRRERARFEGALSAADEALLVDRHLRPRPRTALVGALRSYARAALDVSDGFAKDLARLAGPHGAKVFFAALPLSPPASKALRADAQVAQTIVSGGDDFEILIAVAPESAADFAAMATTLGVRVSEVGAIGGAAGVTIIDADGRAMALANAGYDHFSARE